MMTKNNIIKFVNIFFLIGWLLMFIDAPMRYPKVGETFFTQFILHPSLWAVILYVLFVEYLLFFILNQKESKKILIFTTAILFLPFLYFLKEFLNEFIYCVVSGNFCGDVYPPTLLSYISKALIGIIPVVNIFYLLTRIKKQKTTT